MKDKNPSGSESGSKSRDTDDANEQDEQVTISYDYHYIWWNAWLYSGSDNLWAGLIKALHEAVEERYGAPYVRCCARYHTHIVLTTVIYIYIPSHLAGARTSRCNDRLWGFLTGSFWAGSSCMRLECALTGGVSPRRARREIIFVV